MDHKKSPNRRSKRQSKLTEESYWDCSVCTYRNSAEAFKCMMCDVRKGTSTRKPRINPQLVAQQVAQQYTQALPKVKKDLGGKSELANMGGRPATPNSKEASRSEKKGSTEAKTIRKARPKLKNVDRSSAEHKAVTVNNVTVIITEFQPKRHPSSLASSESSLHGSGGGSASGMENGNHSDSTNHSGDSHSDGRSS